MSDKSDDELDRQMRSLASQLSDDNVREIRDRLGLREPDDPRVTRTSEATCSFCGADDAGGNRLIKAKSGAVICARCLSSMQSS